MKITGSRLIAAPMGDVVSTLRNGQQFVQAVPDLRLNAPLDDQQQRATVSMMAGPLQGQYEATFVFTRPETAVYTFKFDGHGAKGIFQGNGRLHLEDQNNQTLIHYTGEIEVAGRLADLPPRLVQANVNAVVRRCLDGIERTLWPEKFAVKPEILPPAWLKTAVPAGLLLLATFLLSHLIGKKIHERNHSGS